MRIKRRPDVLFHPSGGCYLVRAGALEPGILPGALLPGSMSPVAVQDCPPRSCQVKGGWALGSLHCTCVWRELCAELCRRVGRRGSRCRRVSGKLLGGEASGDPHSTPWAETVASRLLVTQLGQDSDPGLADSGARVCPTGLHHLLWSTSGRVCVSGEE